MNSTDAECSINIPGLWHNGDCSLLCRPTKWYDIFIFFLGNYLAHVATVVSPPGASTITRALNLIGALLLPFSGVGLGIEAIRSLAIFASTPLETAARAGALLMVVRTDPAEEAAKETLRPQRMNSEVASNEASNGRTDPGQDTVPALRERPRSYRPWMAARIHGNFWLPEGFKLERVPGDMEFEDNEEDILTRRKKNGETPRWYDFLFGFSKRDKTANDIACSYNGAKAIVAIVQIVFGIYTLYRIRGNQVERFGYAAYGLTVTPYALMSIVNLTGNLLRPDYTSMYIVGSSVSDEIQKAHCFTIATIGRIREPRRPHTLVGLFYLRYLGLYVGAGIHLLIIGLMTDFDKGQSTLAQRAWTMAWLSIGAGYGVGINMMNDYFDSIRDTPYLTSLGNRFGLGDKFSHVVIGIATLALGVPNIGGFVVVAQMIRQYGVCSKILDASV